MRRRKMLRRGGSCVQVMKYEKKKVCAYRARGRWKKRENSLTREE